MAMGIPLEIAWGDCPELGAPCQKKTRHHIVGAIAWTIQTLDWKLIGRQAPDAVC
jgi:hypothetical protein